MPCQRRSGKPRAALVLFRKQADSLCTQCGRIAEWIAKRVGDRNGAECTLPSPPPRTIRELQQRTKDMKKLFSTAAIIAALASAVPVSAQRTGPGPTANPGTGPGVFLPGGVGPSSPLDNLNEESAGLPGAASYPQRLAWVRLLA